jgi:hypothetical protein
VAWSHQARQSEAGLAGAWPVQRFRCTLHQVVYWPRPVHDREWVDAEGTSWRIRGGDLDQKQFRRLLKRPDVHVVRAYELYVAEVHDVEREALLARVEEYFRGQAPRYTDFELGDFRDATHRVVLIVQGC